MGKYRNTYYYVAEEAAFPSDPRDTPILDKNGDTIAMVHAKYKKALDIEGSGKLTDGRVVNYATRVDGQVRYRVTKAPYGNGVGICKLKPFESIAVDREKIPLGSIVRIKETVGMPLPNGKLHNGLWRAIDVGGAIKKDRVDIFIGFRRHAKYLSDYGVTHLKPLNITLIKKPKKKSCVDQDP